MKLVSWNVNGIRAVHRKGHFLPFIEQLQPDIICLQETKAEKHQSEIDLAGFEEYWNSAERKGYSGTAIFSRATPHTVAFGFPDDIAREYSLDGDGYGDPNKEGRLIAAEYDAVWVVSVYTPNAKPDLSRLALRHRHWDPAFLKYMQRLDAQKPVIFCGDLNVAHTPADLANPKQNEGEHGFTLEEREGIDKIVQAKFVDTFRLFHEGNGQYTWWSNFSNARARNVGWRIDYVFVSARLVSHVRKAEIHADVLGSDHCPVSVTIKGL